MIPLDRPLRDRVLARLGFPRPPAADLAGLRALYGAWCAAVPFDNVRKMIALRSGGALPGSEAPEFFEAWLEHGTGGTCWPTSHALCALLESCGFAARRVAGAMRDLGVLNHGSVKVRFGADDWLADSSMLTGAPLPLGPGIYVADDPVFAAEVEAVDGSHVVWADLPPNPEYLPCRILVDPSDHAAYLAGYEASRAASPFNQRLFARRNRPGEIVILYGRTRFGKTAAGRTSRDLDAEGLRRALREEIGLSARIVEAWEACGALAASFEPPAGPKPPPAARRPPSKRSLP